MLKHIRSILREALLIAAEALEPGTDKAALTLSYRDYLRKDRDYWRLRSESAEAKAARAK